MSDDPLTAAQGWLAEGRRAALASVVSTWGSAPRPAGSHLAIREDGAMIGSVSGGCVEGAVVEAAIRAMEGGVPRLLSFGVSDDEAQAVGLACGGTIEIWVEPAPAALELLEAERSARRPAALLTRLDDGAQALFRGETVAMDGVGVADRLLEATRAALATERSGRLPDPFDDHYLRIFPPPLRLFIIGGVHIAQELSAMAARAGYACAIIDPRQGWANAERFPDAPILDDWPDDALTAAALDARCAVAALSHDPKLDDPALMVALQSPAFYVGALGGKRSNEKRAARLAQAGLDAAAIARLNAPIGLPIGAQSPAEIAIATLAQMTAALRAA